jgi:hypothetical protein
MIVLLRISMQWAGDHTANEAGGAEVLAQFSITAEVGLIVAALTATAMLTTLVSP